MEKKLTDIKKISTYESAWNVLENYGDGETENCIQQNPEAFGFSEDDIIFLQHFDDWEYLQYMVIDDNLIMVRDMDDMIVFCNTYTEWYKHVMEMLQEDREERE